MGDAVNLTARLMSLSQPNQILISRQIAIEAGSSFVLQEMSPVKVKGKREPIAICALKEEHTPAPGGYV
jgi:class 3 adenylate cyclase